MDHTLPAIEKAVAEKLIECGGVYDPAKLEKSYKDGDITDMHLAIIAVNQRNVQLIALATIDNHLDRIQTTSMVLRLGVFIIAGIAVIDAFFRWGTV